MLKSRKKAEVAYLFVITSPATIAKDANFSSAYPSIQLAPTEPNLWAHAGPVVCPVALTDTWPSSDCAAQTQLKKIQEREKSKSLDGVKNTIIRFMYSKREYGDETILPGHW